MNAMDLLKRDHQRILGLLGDIADAVDYSEQLVAVQNTKRELLNHLSTEEEFLYPLFENKNDCQTMIEEFCDAHQQFAEQLNELEAADEEFISELVEELIQAVGEHFDEEENEFFPYVEKTLPPQEMKLLEDRLKEEGQKEEAA